MTSDLNKIQTNHVTSVQRTEKKQKTQDIETQPQENSYEVEEMTTDTGVVGRSTVKSDNFETDMKKLKENYAGVAARVGIIDLLLKKGDCRSLEEAIYATHTEFDN